MLRRRVDGEEMNPSHASTHNSALNSTWFRPNLMLVLLSSSLGESQRNAPFFSTSFFFFFSNQAVLRRNRPGLLS